MYQQILPNTYYVYRNNQLFNTEIQNVRDGELYFYRGYINSMMNSFSVIAKKNQRIIEILHDYDCLRYKTQSDIEYTMKTINNNL